jgi:hypothetical protein
MKQNFVQVQISPRQLTLVLRVLEKLIAQGAGPVGRYCESPNMKQARHDLISLDGVATRLRKSNPSQAADSNNELLCIEWPDDVDGDGRGQLTDVFFKFCDEHSISIGQQIIVLALFAAAGVELGVRISEQDFTRAMEHMKELADGKLKFTTMQGYSDQ